MPPSSGRSGRSKAARDPGGQDKSGATEQGGAGRRRRSRGGQVDRPAGNEPVGAAQSGQADPSPAQRQRQPRRKDQVETGAARQESSGGRRRTRRMRTVDEISAGGLVVDRANSKAAVIGRIDRRGRLLWSLPKGHIEAGETPEQAAVREVAEETGIAAAVVATLGSIDYWFVADDRRVHKTVHHFLLRAHGGELSDADVEVAEVAWVPLPELQKRLAYADERRLVRRATRLLADPA